MHIVRRIWATLIIVWKFWLKKLTKTKLCTNSIGNFMQKRKTSSSFTNDLIVCHPFVGLSYKETVNWKYLFSILGCYDVRGIQRGPENSTPSNEWNYFGSQPRYSPGDVLWTISISKVTFFEKLLSCVISCFGKIKSPFFRFYIIYPCGLLGIKIWHTTRPRRILGMLRRTLNWWVLVSVSIHPAVTVTTDT